MGKSTISMAIFNSYVKLPSPYVLNFASFIPMVLTTKSASLDVICRGMTSASSAHGM